MSGSACSERETDIQASRPNARRQEYGDDDFEPRRTHFHVLYGQRRRIVILELKLPWNPAVRCDIILCKPDGWEVVRRAGNTKRRGQVHGDGVDGLTSPPIASRSTDT
ncbi:hypothetical protein QAD02_022022 [Eretmocerus hayati]|uniref:Uncharacterized protein n=1 Tax=Eretmocerus hayati TaxID=131215 RepID=A0ACC2PRW5_9HYME|nr:hypothetical protein QAD02_022022 [Eretmocerus hayati]